MAIVAPSSRCHAMCDRVAVGTAVAVPPAACIEHLVAVSVVDTVDGGVGQLIGMHNRATGHQIIVIVRTSPTAGVPSLIPQVCGNS
jgi:hypothetical protein